MRANTAYTNHSLAYSKPNLHLSSEHTRHIRRRTRQEKSPPPSLPTQNRQPLQIPHLPNRTPPKRQQALMQEIQLRHRPNLKRGRIARHAGKITIVQPVPHALLAREPCPSHIGVGAGCCGEPFFGAEFVVSFYEARADEEDVADADVASFGFGEEVKTLRGGTRLQVG